MAVLYISLVALIISCVSLLVAVTRTLWGSDLLGQHKYKIELKRVEKWVASSDEVKGFNVDENPSPMLMKVLSDCQKAELIYSQSGTLWRAYGSYIEACKGKHKN